MTRSPHCNTLHRPWAVWLAVLIAVLGAIAPTVTHALMLATGQSPQGVEICTTEGTRWVTADAAASSDDSNPEPGSVVPPAHCPFCLQPTDRVALINVPLTYPFLVQDGESESPVWQVFFYSVERTLTPPSRGPPGFL
jgi:hypothetical protein